MASSSMGEFQRDQHSRQYDGYARKALLGAIRSRAAGGRGVRVFVVSPAAQFGNRDRGGLTVNERAFSRAAYYPVQQVPRQLARAKGLGREGAVYVWSLKLAWGKLENRRGRWGRTVGVRVFPYRAGRRHVARHADRAYTAHPELRSTAAVESAG